MNRSNLIGKSTISSLILACLAINSLSSVNASPLNSNPLKVLKENIKPINLPNGKPAMVAYSLTGNNQTNEEWLIALRQMREMGVQVVELGQLGWADTEKKPGNYNWGYAEKVLRINKEENLGLQFVADIGMFINPGLDGKPKLPVYLTGKNYDDPIVIAALSNLYKAFLNLPGADSVKYLFNHFENAESSFKCQMNQRPRAQKLLRESFAAAKQERPDIKTGVCIESYERPHYSEKMIAYWNLEIGTDIVPIISFGPANYDKKKNDVNSTITEFESILTRTRGKPIALNETLLQSSTAVDNSSPEKQADFVRELFKLLAKHHDSIEFATWYEYCDLDPAIANILGLYLGTISYAPWTAGYFADFMGSCGLFTTTGKMKPAAQAWCEEIAKYYKIRAKEKRNH